MHLIEKFDELLSLLEAKKKNIIEPPPQQKVEEPQEKPKLNVRIIAGDMHVKSLKNIRHLPNLVKKTSELLEKKRQDPHGKLSNDDYPLGTSGGFASFPGLMHVPVSHNLRLWYAVVPVKKGKETEHQVRAFGVYTHDETGTGSPPNIALQKATALRMSNESDKLSTK